MPPHQGEASARRAGPTGGVCVTLFAVNFVIAAPHHLPRLARLRRAGWVVACLWLLVALMPLRAWAVAGMGVAVLDAASEAAAVAEFPPCHAETGEDAPPTGEHSACSQCVLCSPVLASAPPDGTTLPRQDSPPPGTAAGLAPAGVLESLFRPPRG